MKHFQSFFVLFFSVLIYAQNYPTDFRSPLDIPRYLSGNFAELRGFHFHSGIDIKTQQREGFPVYAVADGYVSRINVSPRGYGHALYIDHPNGYTSVYAHLQRFEGEVLRNARDQQYAKESFAIDYKLNKDQIRVKKGDVIGFSGNTGGSQGPHLHFEIRETATQNPMNPFLFGFAQADNSAPLLRGMYIYALDGDAAGQKRYNLEGSARYTHPVLVSGNIGVGVKAYDRHNGANNLNGVYRIQVFNNDKEIFRFQADKFGFDESRMINCQTDYAEYMSTRGWIYQLFRVPGNSLQMLSNLHNDGIIATEEGKEYKIRILLTDYSGNKTEGSFVMKGKAFTPSASPVAENRLRWSEDSYFENDFVKISVPARSVYEDMDWDVRRSSGSYFIMNDKIPLHKFITLAIKPENIPASKLDKAVIAVKYNYGNRQVTDYFPTVYKDGSLIAEVRDFGEFFIEIDDTAPSISALNFPASSTSAAPNLLRFQIKDAQSGIFAYDAYIDGKWVLTEYDKKNDLLTLNLSREGVAAGKHSLELRVKDGNNNIRTFNGEFTKK
ncbi:MAG: M23 family metallopeptidase [Weeksellaceae bacterium]|nr:M23 family metallopeptidase [Weeksellaceae bacterium]